MDRKRVPSGALGQKPSLALASVLERLTRVSQPGDIDAAAVQRALALRSRYLAERLLVALSGKGRGFASAAHFLAAAQEVMAAQAATKLEFLFRMHDENADGFIEREELERLLHIAVAENDLTLSEAEIDRLVAGVMNAGDHNADGRIDYAEFVAMMAADPRIEERLAEYGVSLLMPGKRARQMALLPGDRWSGWVRNELMLAAWLCAIFVANAALFLEAFLRYREAGAGLYVQIARGCGACLNLNGALIAVPMLRHTLTWVRRSALGRIVPVDDAVSLHALIGEVIVVFSLVHTGAHLLNLAHTRADPWSAANVTGFAALLVLLVMWICSRDFVRRSGRFELFYLTHLAYLAFVALLFLHGPRFFLWGTVPWAWFLIERTLRARRRRVSSRVLAARPLASSVTRLQIERPAGFHYAAGDYVFLRLPVVARNEWHPFTLTSAPEDPQRLTFHIRCLGNWTAAVREHVPRLLPGGRQVLAHVDGPYGTASRHVLEVPHAVAIAGGIGVTPFASILQSLLLRAQAADAPLPVLRKLRFVWLNRDQYSFEWFRDLLADLEQRDRQGLLDIHTFMTAGRADMAGGLLDFAWLVSRTRSRGDLVTGLQAPTKLGAPDFDRLLESFCNSPDLPQPAVFFCGPLGLERVVARTCRRLGLRLRRERF